MVTHTGINRNIRRFGEKRMTTLPRVQFGSAWLLIDHEPKRFPFKRNQPTLTAFLGFCHEQGLHPKRLKPEDLFAPETLMFHKE